MKIELCNMPQWVCYKLMEKDGKITKIPISATSGKGASSTNPNDWVDYKTAWSYKVNNNLDGIGFVLTENDPYTCIDLDDCIFDGQIKDYAKEIMDKFNTYTEISQSGKGVHIFLKGTKPGDKSRKNTGEPIEIYDKKRYIAITGNAIKKLPITNCQEALNEVYSRYFDCGENEPSLIPPSFGDDPNLIPPSFGDEPSLIPPSRGATRKNSENFFSGGVNCENTKEVITPPDPFGDDETIDDNPKQGSEISDNVFPPTASGVELRQKSNAFLEKQQQLAVFSKSPNINVRVTEDNQSLPLKIDYQEIKGGDQLTNQVENNKQSVTNLASQFDQLLKTFNKSDKRQKLLHLFDGNYTVLGYPSQSEADGAFMYYLAYYTNCNRDLMDYTFRHSGLYRAKYERTDYRNTLINNAIRDIKKETEPVNKDFWHVPGLLEDYSEVALCDYVFSLYGENMKFNVHEGKWLIWNEKFFQKDEEGVAINLVISALNHLKEEMMKIHFADKEKAIKYVIGAKSSNKIKSILDILKSKKGVSVNSDILDYDKHLINCKNGVINLKNGEFLPHDRKYLMTKIINIPYSEYKIIEDIEDSKFYKFMMEITKENLELIDYHQRNIGYFLTGETKEQSFYIYYGKGSTGKSTLTNLIKNIMGDYCKVAPTGTFTETSNQKYFELSSLTDARLVLSSENSDKYKMDERLIKQISGGDTVSCCYKGQDFFQYTPKYKVLITTNEINQMRSQGYDMKRRLKVIPFKQRFGGDSKEAKPLNDNLNEELMNEAEYVLNWMVRGAIKYYKEGIKVPDIVITEINEVMAEQDPLSAWEAECYTRDENSFIPVSELWDSFATYCQNLNSASPFKTINGFSRNLAKRDYLRKGMDNRERGFFGLAKINLQ